MIMGLASGEVLYCGHMMHASSEMLAVLFKYLPLAHSRHGVDPLISLKVPAGHSMHAPPSGPVYPALQLQAVSALLPGGA